MLTEMGKYTYSDGTTPKICIIGAGFSGLTAAIKLKKDLNISSFQVFEENRDVGGTWLVNTYPGCECDIESHLYCWSFEQNPNWSKAFSPNNEIWEYMREVTRKYYLYSHIKFNTKVVKIEWEENIRQWRVTLINKETNEEKQILFDLVINGPGALRLPSFSKLFDSFTGPKFHTAEWDSTVQLKNKVVGIIGSGASAVQVITNIAPKVKELHCFQRKPAWVTPRDQRDISEHTKSEQNPKLLAASTIAPGVYLITVCICRYFYFPYDHAYLYSAVSQHHHFISIFMTTLWLAHFFAITSSLPLHEVAVVLMLIYLNRNAEHLKKWIFRVFPFILWLYRWILFLRNEIFYSLFMYNSLLNKAVNRRLQSFLRGQLPKNDPKVDLLMPNYTIGCKRITKSSDYYPTLALSHVTVIRDKIIEIKDDVIHTEDGKSKKLDVLILATGFQVQNYFAPLKMIGRDGRDINDIWKNDKPISYYGITTSMAPNHFILLGPNTGLGHNSVVFMIECQANFIMNVIREMILRNKRCVSVKRSAEEKFLEVFEEQMKKTVWALGNCDSWYANSRGTITALWPFTCTKYWAQTRTVDHSKFVYT